MSSNDWLYWLVLAAVIIGGLAFYAVKLLLQLKQQNIKLKQAEIAHQQGLFKHDKSVLDSVIIIVRAMKEEQCDISEGCWRLCVLLDSLKTSQDLNNEFPAIFELYEAIKHMPILAERKKLEKKQRMKLDLERMKVEADLSPAIHQNLQILHQYAIERVSIVSQ
jgi:hypothetical protein